jgi:BirA family biotin operon repressor/biotin-[acetyl-CoA-carboxylase] ligase
VVDRYDGGTAPELAARLGVPQVALHGTVASTMDLAHAAAAQGAPAGTIIIANEQARGRGRSGGRWVTPPGAALLFTVLERPVHRDGIAVLSLRVGLALYRSLTPWARSPLGLKWPNDLFDAQGKLAGILVEARWREAQPEWVAVGIGINVRAPDAEHVSQPVSWLAASVTRVAVLEAVLPAVRTAAAATGPLTDAELATWATADRLAGRRILEPVAGVVQGISPDGALAVRTDAGLTTCHSGHIIFADD